LDCVGNSMRQKLETFTVKTCGAGLYELTNEIERRVALSELATGLVTVFCAHTSASLLIQENADPDVRRDLNAFFRRLVPAGDELFTHTAEGPDDMPAHVKAALTLTSLGIPFNASRMMLGTWQGIYLFEHRTAPHIRRIVLHILGT